MTDPISPTGSPGQLPPVVPGSPTPAPVQTGEGTSVSYNKAAATHTSSEDLVQITNAKTASRTKANAAPPTKISVDEAIKTLRDYIKNLPSDLQFRADNESGYIICKVINPVTRDVIRQYPPEELIEMARRLRNLAETGSTSGTLLDKEL